MALMGSTEGGRFYSSLRSRRDVATLYPDRAFQKTVRILPTRIEVKNRGEHFESLILAGSARTLTIASAAMTIAAIRS
jgi:hypothetical protein